MRVKGGADGGELQRFKENFLRTRKLERHLSYANVVWTCRPVPGAATAHSMLLQPSASRHTPPLLRSSSGRRTAHAFSKLPGAAAAAEAAPNGAAPLLRRQAAAAACEGPSADCAWPARAVQGVCPVRRDLQDQRLLRLTGRTAGRWWAPAQDNSALQTILVSCRPA